MNKIIPRMNKKLMKIQNNKSLTIPDYSNKSMNFRVKQKNSTKNIKI